MNAEWLHQAATFKSLGLLIFFATFCMILVWLYGDRERSVRLEEQRNLPFLDDDHEAKD